MPSRDDVEYWREYRREYGKRHYAADKDKYREKAKASRARARERRRLHAVEILRTGCVDCAEADIIVLQFDHVRGVKVCNVTDMIRNGTAWQKFLDEIAKCEVVCSNCHIRRTADRSGLWWKSRA